MLPKWPGHSSILPPQDRHLLFLSTVPIRGSSRPLAFGCPFSIASACSIVHTDMSSYIIIFDVSVSVCTCVVCSYGCIRGVDMSRWQHNTIRQQQKMARKIIFVSVISKKCETQKKTRDTGWCEKKWSFQCDRCGRWVSTLTTSFGLRIPNWTLLILRSSAEEYEKYGMMYRCSCSFFVVVDC